MVVVKHVKYEGNADNLETDCSRLCYTLQHCLHWTVTKLVDYSAVWILYLHATSPKLFSYALV